MLVEYNSKKLKYIPEIDSLKIIAVNINNYKI